MILYKANIIYSEGMIMGKIGTVIKGGKQNV